jgi:amino acid transporter
MGDTGPQAGTSPVQQQGQFARQSTGLVRDVSTTSALFMNWLSGFPPFVLGVGIFFILSAFSGANLYGTYALAALIGIPILFTIGLISSLIPRSGGDWVVVTRTLGPYVGIISSACAMGAFVLATAYLAYIFTSSALAPCLAALGLVSDIPTFTHWASTISTSQNWTFGIAMVVIVGTGLLHVAGVRWALRFLRWGAVFALLGFLLAGIVALLRSRTGFIHTFNDFSQPVTHQADTYHTIITDAHKAGIDTSPPFNLTTTWIASGIVLGQVIYNYLALYVAGEIRKANSFRVTATMVGSLVATCGLLALWTLIFFHGWGRDFLTAINGINGTPDYPFAAPPFYVFLAAIGAKSAFLSWIIALAFLVAIPLLILVIWFLPSRIIFSWAFDGLLPYKVSEVGSNRQVPYYALAMTFVLFTGGTAWAVYDSGGFLTVLAYTIILQLTSMFLLCLSGTIIPFLRRELWRSATTARTIGGIPLITISGIFGMAAIVAVYYLFFRYPALGIKDRGQAVIVWASVCGAAVIFFVIARWVRSLRGENLALAYAEIPPE